MLNVKYRRNGSQHKKAIHKPTANILNLGKAESKLSIIWSETKMPTFTTSVQQSAGNPVSENSQVRKKKGHPNWKKKVRLSLRTA